MSDAADIVNVTTIMVLQPDGDVGIETTSPNYRLQVGETSNYGYVDTDGSWQTGSDIRFKENIRSIESGLDKILSIKGVEYNVIGDDPDRDKTIGFIAQEIEVVIPEIVSTDPDGYKGISYAKLTPILVEAIKEQQKQIEELQKKVESLME